MPGDAIISRVKQKLHLSPKTFSPPDSPVQDPSPVDAVAVRDQCGAAEAREPQADTSDTLDADPRSTRYGILPINGKAGFGGPPTSIREIAEMKPGDKVLLRARIHHLRSQGPKLAFIVLRHQLDTIQGLVVVSDGTVSEDMVRWMERLPLETIVRVSGVLQAPGDGQSAVHNATVHNMEILIESMHVVSQVTKHVPFDIEDASRPESDFQDEHFAARRVTPRAHFTNRVASLRSATSLAIFRIRAGACTAFRAHLDARGFTEIQSSKFQQGASESGASVFTVNYFKRQASLAQSPQLAKQMCIAADMERVYEIGPVFRAENSHTGRHLTEFTGMDLEQTIDVSYTEVLDTLDGVLKHIFATLQECFRTEIEVVKRQFPHEDLVWREETPRLTFKEGIAMLREAGWTEEDGSEPSEEDDLSTPAEKKLGALVKEKYETDFYILDKFPLAVRPFYTMPDPDDETYSNSADFFLRGQEILSGGQRIHHAPLLEQRMKEAKIDLEPMEDYLDGFRWGCPPHGGGGIGLERVIMLFLDLGNVRWTNLFPRDPASFPGAQVDPNDAGGHALRGPESSTVEYAASLRVADVPPPLPPLENLIATYADSNNTAWLDPQWTVWRDAPTGGAVGYCDSEGHTLVWGRPLCDDAQLHGVIARFLKHVDPGERLKVLWACADEVTESLLTRERGWASVIVAAEERLDPTAFEMGGKLAQKVRSAQTKGVVVVSVGEGTPGEEVRQEIDRRVGEWREGRTGKQVHSTDIRPWDDEVHRKYFYAKDGDGKVCAIVVLAQLSRKYGFQIKFSLEFPGAPSGSIELLLTEVISAMAAAGLRTATFGTSATESLTAGENTRRWKAKMMESAYATIAKTLGLGSKPEFRAKFGTELDSVYFCYPRGLDARAIHAVTAALTG
ncbi:aspartyl-tRNA synthetase cytoplasmic [Mycena metata]|uniref:aspartate--tRNA ligase n=1 Tax=Mycena metata TaxID=1033252 RepID=A0AAD7HZN3_9AGAR|nr:aspartyl-tRNA synthetase cytoplasmic [Mycena metata]